MGENRPHELLGTPDPSEAVEVGSTSIRDETSGDEEWSTNPKREAMHWRQVNGVITQDLNPVLYEHDVNADVFS